MIVLGYSIMRVSSLSFTQILDSCEVPDSANSQAYYGTKLNETVKSFIFCFISFFGEEIFFFLLSVPFIFKLVILDPKGHEI